MDIAGLVSSIITFVDFSWTIVRGAYDLHNSTSGATDENAHVGHVLQDLRDVTEKMRIGIRGRDDHEKALLELQHQCHALSGDLAGILQKLTTKRRSGLQSLNILLRSLMQEKEVRAIEKRLGEYRGQMILRLNLILLERSETRQDTRQPTSEVEDVKLRDLKEKALALAADNFVLRQLYFDDMYSRADNITDATDGTFDWLFHEHESRNATTLAWNFHRDYYSTIITSWELQERERRQQNATKISNFVEQNGGVFFLCGKPGSGKSTLMKYLVEGRGQQKMHQKLQKWAGQKRLVCLSAMFLLHGTPLQRSLEGFYRTFFFELICQCPGLDEMLFPKDSTREFPNERFRSSFRLKTLQEAWASLISIKDHGTLRICAFIDGLDELEGNSGDRFDFAQTLRDWAQSDDIKVICSGRPNVELNSVFNQPHYRIDLQDLTTLDIRKIVARRLQGLHRFGGLTEHNLESLANEICRRSEGVILWAVLVAKNLEDDIIHGETLSTMKRTIQSTPAGIDDLFDGIWQSLRHDAHQQLMLQRIYELVVLFAKVKSCRSLKNAVSLYWLEDALSSDDFPYNQPIQALSNMELASRLNIVRARMVQYTKHLVEIPGISGMDGRPTCFGTCQFVHRSAKEFIQSKLGLLGPVSAQYSRTFELYLRLQLILEMNSGLGHNGTRSFLETVFFWRDECHPDPQKPVYQLHYRMMEKLREISEAGPVFLLGAGLTTGNTWTQGEILGRKCLGGYTKEERAYMFLHIAIGLHQGNYVSRVVEDKTRQLDRENANLGLLICAAGTFPTCDLFKVLVNHGADPGSSWEVYRTKREADGTKKEVYSELVPLWLLFCRLLTDWISPSHSLFSHDGGDVCWKISMSDDPAKVRWKKKMSERFSILEQLLLLGHAVDVKFLASTESNDREAEEDRGFIMDLVQVVRYAEPHNMDRLLSLLEPPSTTCSSLFQLLISSVLQPKFPFQALPHGAEIKPCRRVSDEFLRRNKWEICGAFDGEHELMGHFKYNVPLH